MSDTIDPVSPAGPDRRTRNRRTRWRRAVEANDAETAMVTIGPDAPAPTPGSPPVEPAAAFATQLLGQPGQKRGLRGGPETLEKARLAYLDAVWRGRRDRRIARGVATVTDV